MLAAGAGLSEGMLNALAHEGAGSDNSLSLIGYSDSNAFRWWGNAGLSVVDLPISEIAGDLCLKLIQRATSREPADQATQSLLYDSRLILRGSVHPLTTKVNAS